MLHANHINVRRRLGKGVSSPITWEPYHAGERCHTAQSRCQTRYEDAMPTTLRWTCTAIQMNDSQFEWDVFISYAGDDRDAVAAPLRDLLSGFGVRVWFDQIELRIGDSLRQRIDDGLSRSRYGVVILSPSFFSRHWPTQELNGLAQRETEGRKVILPVWHGVGPEEVRRYSPILADRVAAKTELGIEHAAVRILRVVRPDVIERIVRAASSILVLPRVVSGQELAAIVWGSDAYLPLNEDPANEQEAATIGDFLQSVQEWGDILDEVGADGRVHAEFSLRQQIEDLESAGFGVYAIRQKRRVRIAGQPADWDVAAVAILQGFDRTPYLLGDQLFVDRPSAEGHEQNTT